MTYEEVKEYIKKLSPFVPKKTSDGKPLFDLTAVAELAAYFGNPQDKLKCVHIAGTNGKGSVAEFLSEILLESGYRVGTFTSPYMKDIREQTKVNGKPISEQAFADCFGEVIEASEKLKKGKWIVPSEFEMDVLASFLFFLKEKCNICIIEAGLGGEYDATNIIANPLLCIFTEISKDHMMVLGESLEEISAVKSGIIKSGGYCISTRQEECVLRVLREKADLKECVFSVSEAPVDVKAGLSGLSFLYNFEGNTEKFETKLTGCYQAENAALSLKAAEKLKIFGFNKITTDSAKKALLNVKRPGRFEIICTDPVVIADGAHNTAGVKAMTESLKEFFPGKYFAGKGFVFLAGVLEDKEYDEMLRTVVPHAYKVFTVTPNNIRAMPADKLAEIFERLGADAEVVGEPREALLKAKVLAIDKDMPVVVFGSLYFMGKITESIQ